MQKMIIVTTSWDDGHPLDLRLAEMLATYGLKGTFYVPLYRAGHKILNKSEIRLLRSMGMEIGSHTHTHAIMTQINRDMMFQEAMKSKQALEDILGEPITSFCYPKGKFNRITSQEVKRAGYHLARTTMAFRTELNFDPFFMPTSFQFFPHSLAARLRHAVKDKNLTGLIRWTRAFRMETRPLALSEIIWKYIVEHGGVLHIWGHSWEIEQMQLWDELKAMCQLISQHAEARYLSNTEVVKIEKETTT